MKIRTATLSDVSGIAKVHVDSWKTTYAKIIPDEYLHALTYESREHIWEITISQGNVYVAENGEGQIIGFSSGGKERSGKYRGFLGELYAIYILKEYQGRGIGKRLVQSVVDELIESNIYSMIVLVLEENDSLDFYVHLGGELLDQIEIEIAGKKANELVYGWEDIRSML